MLTIHSALRIPAHVSFSVVGEEAFLLNAQTNKYYGLQEVGARLWEMLAEGKSLQEARQALSGEYAVSAEELERDLLELLEEMQKNGLVEVVE